jgi:hypothetical protein
MARLLIGLAIVTLGLWALNWALLHYGVVLLVSAGLCAWYFLSPTRHG